MTGDGLRDMWHTVLQGVPKALAFVVILVLGWLLARGLRSVVAKGLTRAGFDKALRRGSAGRTLQAAGISATQVCARIVFWAVVLFALQLAFGLWGHNPVSDLLNHLIAWLPRLLLAIVIVAVSAALAGGAHDLVAAALGRLSYGRFLARAAAALIVGLGVIAALDEIQVATSVTHPLLIAVLTTLSGVVIVGVGGGLVRPMQSRWEGWLDKASTESATIKNHAIEYAEARTRQANRTHPAARSGHAEDTRRPEDLRRAQETHRAEDPRRAQETHRAEDPRRAQETHRAEESRRAQADHLIEQDSLTTQTHRTDEAGRVEAGRFAGQAHVAEQADLAEEAQFAEQAHLAGQTSRAGESRLTEQGRLAAEARRAEDSGRAKAAGSAEDSRHPESSGRAGDAHRTAEHHAEQARLAVEAHPADDAYLGPQAHRAEENRHAEQARRAEQTHRAAGKPAAGQAGDTQADGRAAEAGRWTWQSHIEPDAERTQVIRTGGLPPRLADDSDITTGSIRIAPDPTSDLADDDATATQVIRTGSQETDPFRAAETTGSDDEAAAGDGAASGDGDGTGAGNHGTDRVDTTDDPTLPGKSVPDTADRTDDPHPTTVIRLNDRDLPAENDDPTAVIPPSDGAGRGDSNPTAVIPPSDGAGRGDSSPTAVIPPSDDTSGPDNDPTTVIPRSGDTSGVDGNPTATPPPGDGADTAGGAPAAVITSGDSGDATDSEATTVLRSGSAMDEEATTVIRLGADGILTTDDDPERTTVITSQGADTTVLNPAADSTVVIGSGTTPPRAAVERPEEHTPSERTNSAISIEQNDDPDETVPTAHEGASADGNAADGDRNADMKPHPAQKRRRGMNRTRRGNG